MQFAVGNRIAPGGVRQAVWRESRTRGESLHNRVHYNTARSHGQDPPESAQRQIDILRSAAAAFRRRGYHGASVDEISSALKMTKGNLYYYFKNKEDILYLCHDYSLDIMLGILERVEAEDNPPDAKLRKLIFAFVQVIIDELHGTALTLDLAALSPDLLAKVIRKRDRFDRGLRRILVEGMEGACFAAGTPSSSRSRCSGRSTGYPVGSTLRAAAARTRSAGRSRIIWWPGCCRAEIQITFSFKV